MGIFKRKEVIQPDLSQLLSEFNRSLMLIVDMSLLIDYFISKVKQICPVESVYIFLLDENTGKYKLQNREEQQNYTLTNRDRLINWLSVNEKYLILSEHPDILNYFLPHEQTTLRELNTELIYPLKVMNHISGTIFLGNKTDGSKFNEEEIHLLSFLFDQAAFAFEHVSLYEKQTERIKKMYRTDRLATLGELAAGAAHEIRNPLTAIRSTIQYLSKDFIHDPVKSEMMTQLITEVERINKIVQGLLSFARPSQLNTSEVNLEQLISETLVLTQTTLNKNNVEVEFEYFTRETIIEADIEQLKQVLLNMILNAIEAMSTNDPERVRRLIISMEKGMDIDTQRRFLILSFEDTGKGIKENDMENIFNPFFTTKEEGTGLGLAISYGIIHHHDGEIEVKSIPGKGTEFIIKLPQRK